MGHLGLDGRLKQLLILVRHCGKNGIIWSRTRETHMLWNSSYRFVCFSCWRNEGLEIALFEKGMYPHMKLKAMKSSFEITLFVNPEHMWQSESGKIERRQCEKLGKPE